MNAVVFFSVAVLMASAGSSASTFVTYEQFGAKGDGKADDLPAIVAAHKAANEKGLKVRAKDDATYYIGGRDLTAEIKTDTDFGTAKFVIDDRAVSNCNADVFLVLPTKGEEPVTGVGSLSRDAKRLELSFPGRTLVRFEDKNRRQFRRTGNANMVNDGNPQEETLIVNADGTLDPSTPILQDMATVTKATAFPIDTRRLTVRGGVFTTIANREIAPQWKRWSLYRRGIQVRRSNVLVVDMAHAVVDEIDGISPYDGFLWILSTADVTASNCVFHAHRKTTHGTYDLCVNKSVNTRFIDCRESTDITQGGKRYWWAFGSSHCRNMVLDGCTFGRYDAHRGANNVTIRNSRLCVIAAGGWGTLLVENTHVGDYWYLVGLRGDYGSSWNGDIIVRNCSFKALEGRGGYFISAANDGTHDYGYPCHMGRRIVVDGLTVDNGVPGKDAKPFTWVLFEGGKGPKADAPYPYHLPESLTVRNVKCTNGLKPRLADDLAYFKDLPFVCE